MLSKQSETVHVWFILSAALTLICLGVMGCSNQSATSEDDSESKETTIVIDSTELPPTPTTEQKQNTPLPPTNVPTATTAPPSFELSANIAYVRDKNPRHTLDVYLPLTGEPPYPALFMLHPGNFETGNKDWMLPFASYFTSQGYAAIVPNYRLLPDAYPAQLEDSFCALAWTHSNAERFGIDPTHIVTFGYSSGGNLASMIGTVDDPTPYLEDCSYSLYRDWTQGVIDLSGHTVLSEYPTEAFAQYLGGTIDELPEIWQAAAPINHLDGTEPPFLVVHGAADEQLPLTVSEKFVSALTDAQVETVFVPIPNAGHEFPMDSTDEHTAVFLNAATDFLQSLPPRTPVLEVPRIPLTSAEELIGVWKAESTDSGFRFALYMKFVEDGCFWWQLDSANFIEDPSFCGEYWFEDGIFYIMYNEGDLQLCNGREVVGSYEVVWLSENEITFHKLSDTCVDEGSTRAGNMQNDWERIE